MNWLKRLLGLREKALNPVDVHSRGGWFPIVKEWTTGAWQTNLEARIEDTLCYWAVFRCVSLISSDIAKMRVKLLQRDRDRIPTEIDPLPILRRPNAYQNRIQFFDNWISSKLMRGNTYALKQRDGNEISSLYILDPCNVRPLVSDDGSVFYDLRADSLSGIGKEKVAVPASEIIHDRWNAFYHPLVGLSPIYAAGLNALTGLRIHKNASNFFGNGSRPGGILSAPAAISNETAARLKAHWDANFTGENVGKVAVLGDGLKYEQMTMSAVDAQMLEQGKFTAETVAGTFGVPAYMLNVGSTPAYNNVEALSQQYYSQCLQTLIESVELCLDEGLELGANLNCEFDLDDLLRMDTATMVKAEADAIGAGFKTPNESRRRFGLKPVKGGDSPMMQQQNFSLEALAERDQDEPFAKPEPAPAAPPANDNGDDEERGLSLLQKGCGR